MRFSGTLLISSLLWFVNATGFAFAEGVGGRINYRPKDQNLQCRNFLNPKIYLPQEVLDEVDDATGGHLQSVGLPTKDRFEAMPGVIAEERSYWFVGQSWRMLIDNWNQSWSPQCPAFKDSNNKWDFRYLIGIVDGTGEQLHYDGYAVLEHNTVENPLSDGGLFKDAYAANFDLVDRTPVICVNSVMDFTNMDSCRLSTGDGCVPVEIAVNTNSLTNEAKEGVLVCGSHGETANNPGFEDKYDNNMFRMYENGRSVFHFGLGKQKGNVWAQIALEADDQLRQRVAWAFSQILVITPYQVRRKHKLPTETKFVLDMHQPYTSV